MGEEGVEEKMSWQVPEKTFGELFEEVHNRIQLRSKISNALMAIGLYKVKSKSQNMEKYLRDGYELGKNSLDALNSLKDRSVALRSGYVSKVFLDILTDKSNVIVPEKYENYKRAFENVYKLFDELMSTKELNIDESQAVKSFLIAFDKEIESTYEKEEGIYFGYFRTTKF